MRAPKGLESKKTKPIQPRLIEVARTPPTNPTKSQRKKQLVAAPLGSPKEHLRSASKKKWTLSAWAVASLQITREYPLPTQFCFAISKNFYFLLFILFCLLHVVFNSFCVLVRTQDLSSLGGVVPWCNVFMNACAWVVCVALNPIRMIWVLKCGNEWLPNRDSL